MEVKEFMTASNMTLVLAISNMLEELCQQEEDVDKLIKLNSIFFLLTKLASTMSKQRVSIEA